MKVSFARQVKEEVVFNDFDICCQKAILSAIIKVNGTLSLSNQGLLLTIRTENAKIASKVHKMLKEVYHPHIEFLVSRKMKLQKNNVYILKVSKAREILDDLGLMNGLGFHTLPDKKIIQKECCRSCRCGSVRAVRRRAISTAPWPTASCRRPSGRRRGRRRSGGSRL